MFKKQITELTDIATRCLLLATELTKRKDNLNYVFTKGANSKLRLNVFTSEEIVVDTEEKKEKEKGGEIKMQEGWYTYREKEKRWMGRYKLQNGTMVYAYSKKGGTKKECSGKLKKAIADAKQKQKNSIKEINANTVLNQLWNWWWENLGQYKYKASTALNKICQYNSTIGRALGEYELNKIDEANLTKFFSGLQNVTQKKTAKTILTTLLDYAKAKNCIETNPMEFVVIEHKDDELKNTRKKMEILLPEDEERLFADIKKTNRDLHDICLFILYTGLRKGEALALVWGDVDLENNKIDINKNMDYYNNEITQTKTESGARTIPLFPQTKTILVGMGVNNRNETERIFGKINGRSLTSNFQRFCKMYNLNISVHSLRHTFATRCLEAGIMPKVVQEWLGHKDYAITINTYSHVTDNTENGEIKKMQEYLTTLC